MQIIEIHDKRLLNDFVGSQTQSQFLQSFEWGEFQAKSAAKIIRLGVEDSGELIAAATLIKKVLPMGKSYFLCGRGPVVEAKSQELEIMDLLFNEVKKLTELEGAMFLRFEPISEIQFAGWRRKFKIIQTVDVQPSKTLLLDLSLREDELLKSMHQKTRYNVKLAEKKGVKIVEAGIGRFDELWQLMGQTEERDNFRLHGIDYYKKMLEIDSNFLKLFFAEYKGKPIAAGVFSFFGDMVTYLHGASANSERSVMAPYLLHWWIIRRAKRSGFKYYDLFGVDQDKWPGVTRFKNGFGGFEVNYPGTFDLIYDPSWYSIYKMVRKVRRTF